MDGLFLVQCRPRSILYGMVLSVDLYILSEIKSVHFSLLETVRVGRKASELFDMIHNDD